ncbi:microtubule-binding protein TANGLED [Trifolium repens]|nr:microtubule-binding protein TANGLED [Trifolium repens]
MVARNPLRQNLAVLDPVLIRQTLNKVDHCMNRLQELQSTVSGGTKYVSGVNLSPRSTRTYLRTSLRCKQESIRIKNSAQKTSPLGKFPKPAANLGGEWRQMSLPAMLVGETVAEILQASQFTREIVSSVGTKLSTEDPKTPLSQPSNLQADPENTQCIAKRRKEKQNKQLSDSPPPSPLQRARSRINFKVSPPKKVRHFDKDKVNNKYLANRVSPRNRPWARKTVLFPNPLFSSSTSSSHQQQFCKTRSPVISRNRVATTPHKFRIKSPHRVTTPTPPKFRTKSPHTFLIKSPNRVTTTSPPKFRTESPRKSNRVSTPHKFRIESPHKFLIKSPPSPKRTTRLNSPKRCGAASKSSLPISPSRLTAPTKNKRSVQKSDGLVCLSKSSPKRSAASKLRRSFSPSRFVTRLVSPLKSKKNIQKVDGLVSGLKQRPATTVQMSGPRLKHIL